MEKTSSVELLISPANILFQTSSVPINPSSSVTGVQSAATTPNTIPSASSAINFTSSSTNMPHPQPIPHLILSPPPTHAQIISSTSNSLNYVYKIINNGLIEILEKHFTYAVHNFSDCSKKIFDILIRFLEGFYLSQYLLSASLLTDDSIVNASQLQQFQAGNSLYFLNAGHMQAQMNSKYFNYYATIRRDIFEFLLRIRSDTKNRVLLINKLNRRTFQESKYLLLNLR